MQVLRTPDERFEDLPDFGFEPHYIEVDSGDGAPLRMHHLDEGDAAAPMVLLLHGEPSWSYLYRTMIPVLVDAGLRAVAVDLVGFGPPTNPLFEATTRTSATSTGPVLWSTTSASATSRSCARTGAV